MYKIEDDLAARVIPPKRNPKKKKGKPQKMELAFTGGEEKQISNPKHESIPNPKYIPKHEEKKQYYQEDQIQEETN